MSRHNRPTDDDYERRYSPVVIVDEQRRRGDRDDEGKNQRLTPHTPIKLCLRDFLTLIVAVVAIAGGVVTAWRSLQSADARADSRVTAIEARLLNVATKADLRAMAAGIRLCIVQPSTCGELDQFGDRTQARGNVTK